MEYLKAAVNLKRLIKEINKTIPPLLKNEKDRPNRMILKKEGEKERVIEMMEYTNEYVHGILKQEKEIDAMIICDRAYVEENGKQMNYYLYKGYHRLLEKGLTFFQPITADKFEPIGALGFNALEDNIFFSQDEPNFEESTCNAMEADENRPNRKKIVFFIGNLNEDRLIYDIQRLIFDTLNNVYRHKKVQFEFILEISKYGGKPSEELKKRVAAIETYTKKNLSFEYKNAEVYFQWAD